MEGRAHAKLLEEFRRLIALGVDVDSDLLQSGAIEILEEHEFWANTANVEMIEGNP